MTKEKRISALANLRHAKMWKDKERIADETIDTCIEVLKQESKAGHRILDRDKDFIHVLECPECGFINKWGINEVGGGTYNYCPNCRLKMEVEE